MYFMTNKTDFFNNSLVAEAIHKYLIQLPGTEYDDSAKAPSIGYKRKEQRYKFATLHGGKSYQSLVLHVDPGNPVTSSGKEQQIDVQVELDFDINTIRKHLLKTHEVYIPIEKLNSSNPIDSIKRFIHFAYHRQDKD